MLSLLSDDERERAGRFRFDRDRRRFVARRALLRLVLGSARGSDARRLRFAYGPHGKPRLEGESELEFSASHSAGLAAFAVSRRAPVAVDVERVRGDVDVDGLARRFFAPAEVMRSSRSARRSERARSSRAGRRRRRS